jgi:hypothetical protein
MKFNEKGNYRELPVNEEEVRTCFENYKKEVLPSLEWSLHKEINYGNQYLFTLNNEHHKLNVFYKKKSDTTSLAPTGKNVDVVIPICHYIYSKYNNEGMQGINQSFNSFPRETFDLIIDYFDQKEDVKHTKKIIPNGENHRFNYRGESLVINYYTTKKLLLQGKANTLFSDIIYFLITCNYDSNEVLALEQSLHKTCFDSSLDIEGELKNKLPKAYNCLEEVHLKLIRPSLRNVLNSVKHDPDDNSCIAHSILRGVEQILKSYLLENNVEGIKAADSFYGFISRKEVQPCVSNKISQMYKQNAIVKLYNFYCNNRHVIEHTKAIGADTVIKTSQEAYTLVYDALDAINNFYDTVN